MAFLCGLGGYGQHWPYPYWEVLFLIDAVASGVSSRKVIDPIRCVQRFVGRNAEQHWLATASEVMPYCGDPG